MEKNDKILKLIIQVVIIGICIGLIPFTLAFGKGGFSVPLIREILITFSLMAGIVLGFIIIPIYLYEQKVKEGDNKYGNGLMFIEPGESPAPNIPFFKDTLNVILISFIIFSILGLAMFMKGTQVSSATLLTETEAQFTQTDDSIFRLFIVPVAENLITSVVVSVLIIFILRLSARKYNWNPIIFKISSMVLVFMFIILAGIFYHLFRYGGSEADLRNIAIIWGIGALTTVLTGTWIPFWIEHEIILVYFDFAKYFVSSDSVLAGTIIFIVILIFLLGLRLFIKYGKKKR